MKTKILTLILLFAGCTVFSQTDWNTNGNTIGATNWLGSDNNFPLNFRTNNAERMRITQTGNVGIGTTTPTSLLHLNIGSATEIETRFTNSSTGTSATALAITY